ncbi:MAG: hypothetical protein M0Q88_09640 [Bacilli bacterium]|nr:hypothetical protein [Bacilli bacterium]
MTRIPNTKSVVSYAYTIKANGIKIGNLQGFNPSSNRALERIREIMNELDDTKEILPGRTDFQITIDRLETYDQAMMEAFDYPSFDFIHEIIDPIDIIEEIQGPQGKVRIIQYQNCWLQSINKTVREGTISVTESVTAWPTNVRIIRPR